MTEPKLNPDLPLLHLPMLLEEADNMKIREWERDTFVEDVVILVLDRKSVSFKYSNYEDVHWADLIDTIQISPNPKILAISMTRKFSESAHDLQCDSIRSVPERIKQKIRLAFRALIGQLGIYHFKRIWALTVPFGWRDESDIEVELKEEPTVYAG